MFVSWYVFTEALLMLNRRFRILQNMVHATYTHVSGLDDRTRAQRDCLIELNKRIARLEDLAETQKSPAQEESGMKVTAPARE